MRRILVVLWAGDRGDIDGERRDEIGDSNMHQQSLNDYLLDLCIVCLKRVFVVIDLVVYMQVSL